MEKYLIDTNIFLEILLNQDKKNICKSLLISNVGNLYISDFSLHSIGVILIRLEKCDVFTSYMKDIEDKIKIISLENEGYKNICDLTLQNKIDFDDAYQVAIAQE